MNIESDTVRTVNETSADLLDCGYDFFVFLVARWINMKWKPVAESTALAESMENHDCEMLNAGT